jgi:hypothetical protein
MIDREKHCASIRPLGRRSRMLRSASHRSPRTAFQPGRAATVSAGNPALNNTNSMQTVKREV